MSRASGCPACLSRPAGSRGVCRACKAVHQRAWYERNKARHIGDVGRRNRAERDRKRRLVAEYLESHPCVDCGESDPVVLEFDHVRGGKVDNVATMMTQNASWVKVWREIQKCDVRCANCHRRITDSRRRRAVNSKPDTSGDIPGSLPLWEGAT